MTATPLPPGSAIGILGGGQLGRMTAMAAARLGYRTHVFCSESDGPCVQVTNRHTVSSFEDRQALAGFAQCVDVVTYEFENIPLEAVEFLAERVPVKPGPKALAVCRDRLAEKDFVVAQGIDVARYRPVPDPAALAPALAEIGAPAILKATRLGYDGKAQALITAPADAAAAHRRVGHRPAVLEAVVSFDRELSVIAARDVDGNVVCYPPAANRHRNHILDECRVPAAISPAAATLAEAIAHRLAVALDVVGLLSVELFHTGDDQLLVNELAPRPHNSGHWTMDACATSQFEQLVRAICGLPLGPVDRHADAVMTNLIGDDVDHWRDLVAEPGANLHLYGKTEPRPGRKMGHVTRLTPRGPGK